MYDRIVIAGLSLAGIYTTLGIGFALAFVSAGITRVDHEARDSSGGFRLLIVPGVAALWPLLLRRCIHANGQPPLQKDPHR